jgi:hypothetical protein
VHGGKWLPKHESETPTESLREKANMGWRWNCSIHGFLKKPARARSEKRSFVAAKRNLSTAFQRTNSYVFRP